LSVANEEEILELSRTGGRWKCDRHLASSEQETHRNKVNSLLRSYA